ncbi:MAG: hypothetical protein WAM11_13860 [Cyanobium sp.]
MNGFRRRHGSLLVLAWLSLALAPGRLEAESLLPLDAEGFRARYGQEALFRLRLGVDSAPRSGPAAASSGAVRAAGSRPPGPCPAPAFQAPAWEAPNWEAPNWKASAEQRQFHQAVEHQRFFEAGQILGLWQFRHGACP